MFALKIRHGFINPNNIFITFYLQYSKHANIIKRYELVDLVDITG